MVVLINRVYTILPRIAINSALLFKTSSHKKISRVKREKYMCSKQNEISSVLHTNVKMIKEFLKLSENYVVDTHISNYCRIQ